MAQNLDLSVSEAKHLPPRFVGSTRCCPSQPARNCQSKQAAIAFTSDHEVDPDLVVIFLALTAPPFFLKGSNMTQEQLERAVAQATGETLATIRGRGFSFVPMRRSQRPRWKFWRYRRPRP